MTQPELDADQLLGALGELQRAERAELAGLEEPARALAAREPARAQALENRVMHALFGTAAPKPARGLARIGRGLSYAAASCAVAAAALLWVRAPQPSFEVAYTLVPPAPDAATRSVSAATGGTYSLGRSLTFMLRPSVRYSGPLRVLAYAAQGDALIALDAKTQLDPAGGARVVLTTGGHGAHATTLSEGSWELHFYVSPASAAPISETELRQRDCPQATRCLTFSARFVQPEAL